MAQHIPNISIVTTAFQMEDCLKQGLLSLAAQTHADFEAIIVEDGSSDDTPRIADDFARTDPRFRTIHTPRLGAAGARNKGMELIGCPYFMLLDGDDLFLPTMLETLHRRIIETNSDMAVCGIMQFDHHSGVRTRAPWALKTSQLSGAFCSSAFSWRDTPGNIFAAFMGWPWDKMYRTEFVRNEKLAFPENLANSEDMLFTYQAIVRARRIAVVDQELIEHRINRGGSVSNSREQEPLAFYEAICRMKQFLQNQPDDAWERLRHPYLNWALDWTLWNIETLSNKDTRNNLTLLLSNNEFKALELDQHEPAYFTGYPRSMARYTSLLDDCPNINPDHGPFGSLATLPYGKFKPWNQAGFFEKLAIRKRIKENKPTEW